MEVDRFAAILVITLLSSAFIQCSILKQLLISFFNITLSILKAKIDIAIANYVK